MSSSARALFIDLLKGLALVIMIEVRVFNSLLIPSIKQTWWFPYLNFINGLVAPAFTFTSGMVFVLSLQKGVKQLRKFGKEFWKKIGRLGLILLAGYSLHIPSFSFKNIFISPAQQTLRSLFVVDILQIIATGLFVLLTAIIFFKTEKAFYNFCTIITLLILFLCPFSWKTDFYKQMLLIFANYFNRMHGSFFPIFPCGALFSQEHSLLNFIFKREQKPTKKNLLIG